MATSSDHEASNFPNLEDFERIIDENEAENDLAELLLSDQGASLVRWRTVCVDRYARIYLKYLYKTIL